VASAVIANLPSTLAAQSLATPSSPGRVPLRRRRQSNRIRRRVARHARSQAMPYPERARHSVNAIERVRFVNLPGDEIPLLIEMIIYLDVN
jgi:hypothetical protein